MMKADAANLLYLALLLCQVQILCHGLLFDFKGHHQQQQQRSEQANKQQAEVEGDEQLIDDKRLYLRPGITEAQLLRARGYIAREYSFASPDGYVMTITRGTNPLVNNGQRGLDSKLPILFVNSALLPALCYLVNSAHVRPRLHRLPEGRNVSLAQMSVKQLRELIDNDPARKSLPFLALNFGYEIWLFNRRGFVGPRRRLAVGRHQHHRKPPKPRTLIDAFKALPRTLLGNALNGFTLDANVDHHGRPVRTKTHSREPQRASGGNSSGGGNGTIQIEAGQPEVRVDDLADTDRARARGAQSPKPFQNLFELMFAQISKFKAKKLTSELSDLRREFIETFDPDYWSFTLDQQIAIDFPLAIELVLNHTGKRKLHASGLSCGGAVILLALAERPQLAEKISRAVLWAPSVNMGSRSDIVYQLSVMIGLLQSYSGPLPFTFVTNETHRTLQRICSTDFMQRTLCRALSDTFAGYSGDQAPLRLFLLAILPWPTSYLEFAQLGQMALTQQPCKFSFNTPAKNLEMYGQERPPCYNLADIKLRNISIYVGAFDALVSPDDMATTLLQMSVPSELNIIKGDHLYFNHLGMVLHERADELAIMPSLLDLERSQAVEKLS